MAAVHWKSLENVCVIFILASFVGNSWGLVHELNNTNIAKFLQGKLLTLTFIDSPSCASCRIQFPFFVAASQVFPHDPEIFFTRTSDADLIKTFGITELPAIIYHRIGLKSHEQINVDITVDGIIDEIAKILRGNFGRLTRTYCVHANDKNYKELIVTPRQAVILLIHDKDDVNEREEIEKMAYNFRNDDAILFASLDVITQKALRDDKFMTRQTPTVMWFSPETKMPMRFGGFVTVEVLTQFVNEKTQLNRNHRGGLTAKAGLIQEADEILDRNIVHIMEGNTEDMKSVLSEMGALQETVERHHIEYVEYHLYVLENIVAHGAEKTVRAILQEIENTLIKKEVTGLSKKEQDALKRKRNIVARFFALEKKYSQEKKTKSGEEIQMEIDLKKRTQTAKQQAPDHHYPHVDL